MGWPAIQGYSNGEQVVAEVLNKPIRQLAERTDYLLQKLGVRSDANISVGATVPGTVVVDGVTQPRAGQPADGQPVYRDATGVFKQAQALEAQDAWFYANASAMAVGIATHVDDDEADVVLCGFIDFSSSPIPVANVIDDTNPGSGRYYLSSRNPGKLTASPNGPIIYVCDCLISNSTILSMIVNPQYRDTGESHVHREFVLGGLPMGGYVTTLGPTGNKQRYVRGILPTGTTLVAEAPLPGLQVELCGAWTTSATVTYQFSIAKREDPTSSDQEWGSYNLNWTSTGNADGFGSVRLPVDSNGDLQTTPVSVGTHGLQVVLTAASGQLPTAWTGKTWVASMPDAARAWINWYETRNSAEAHVGYRLNLGMYPEMARYVPPVPDNCAEMIVDGLSRRGPAFGDAKQWKIMPADSMGGPWVVWYGGEEAASSATVTGPFIFSSDTVAPTARHIALHVNRMRVGPTGFVTSLQVAKGSPLKITSAQTDAEAVQGALQISMDADFTSAARNVTGSEVVKRINGLMFETGPVVERIIVGAGLSADREQGVVTISASNATYSGDFETIALRNAKQDLLGSVFPYTKLLGWSSTSKVKSGFTAKFRVPDSLPYAAYNVIVSASVFGESAGDGSTASTAAFTLKGSVLPDYSLFASGNVESAHASGVPSSGQVATVALPFAADYTAFDPLVIHGFPTTSVADRTPQRLSLNGFLLKDGNGTAFSVYPGHFVGIDIERCDVPGANAVWYTAPLGFLSLRWNLVAVTA